LFSPFISLHAIISASWKRALRGFVIYSLFIHSNENAMVFDFAIALKHFGALVSEKNILPQARCTTRAMMNACKTISQHGAARSVGSP